MARFVRLAIQLSIHADYRLRRLMPLAGVVRGHFNPVEWDRYGGVQICP